MWLYVWPTTCSISTAWEFVRNGASQQPQTSWILSSQGGLQHSAVSYQDFLVSPMLC